MAQEPKYLSQYNGTDSVGNTMSVVAEDMVTAAKVYNTQQGKDPIILQMVKQKVLCALPDIYVTFNAEAYDSTTAQVITSCKVTPETFVVVAGTKQIFTATTVEGYEFVKWQIDGVDVEDEEGNVVTDPVAVLTIPAPDSGRSVTIRAVFQATV